MFPGCTLTDVRARQQDLWREAGYRREPRWYREQGFAYGGRALQLWFVHCVTALVRLELALVAFLGL